MSKFFSKLAGLVALFGSFGLIGVVSADYLVADNLGSQVLRFGNDGSPLGSFVAPGAGGLAGAVGMVVTPNEELLVSSQNSGSILRYSGLNGSPLGVWASSNMQGPSHMELRSNGNLLVSNFFGSSISQFDTSGNFLGDFTTGTPGTGLQGVASFATAANGDVYVGSFNSGEIFVYDSNGVYQRTFASGFPGASGLWFSGDNLWVASLFADQVALLNPSGTPIVSFSTGQIAPGQGTFPGFITASPFSNDEILISLTAGGGVYRYAIDGSTPGPVNPFLIGNGLAVPGEVLQFTPIPEPGSGLFLTSMALMRLSVRRRR